MQKIYYKKYITKLRNDPERLKKNKEYHHNYYITHKEEFAAAGKKRYNKKRKEIIKQVKKYYKKNRKYKIEYHKNWNKLHPEKNREYRRKRKALVRNLKQQYSSNDELYTYKLFNNKCVLCGSKKNLCIDHHYPISKGYPLTRNNAVLLCNICNNLKRAQDPNEFYPTRVLRIIERKLNLIRSESKVQQTCVSSPATSPIHSQRN